MAGGRRGLPRKYKKTMKRTLLTLGEEGVYDFWSRRIMEAAANA